MSLLSTHATKLLVGTVEGQTKIRDRVGTDGGGRHGPETHQRWGSEQRHQTAAFHTNLTGFKIKIIVNIVLYKSHTVPQGLVWLESPIFMTNLTGVVIQQQFEEQPVNLPHVPNPKRNGRHDFAMETHSSNNLG